MKLLQILTILSFVISANHTYAKEKSCAEFDKVLELVREQEKDLKIKEAFIEGFDLKIRELEWDQRDAMNNSLWGLGADFFFGMTAFMGLYTNSMKVMKVLIGMFAISSATVAGNIIHIYMTDNEIDEMKRTLPEKKKNLIHLREENYNNLDFLTRFPCEKEES